MLKIEYECYHCGKILINTFADSVLKDGDDFIVNCTYCEKDSIIWIYFTATKLERYDDILGK